MFHIEMTSIETTGFLATCTAYSEQKIEQVKESLCCLGENKQVVTS